MKIEIDKEALFLSKSDDVARLLAEKLIRVRDRLIADAQGVVYSKSILNTQPSNSTSDKPTEEVERKSSDRIGTNKGR